MSVSALTADEVLRIHHILCEDFAEADDPIGYGGLKSRALLESAVGRQHAGFGSFRKYVDPISSAATLTFGICCDHPFHNGNKRTALVSMLAHLDKNHLTLKGTVRQDELYGTMVNLASRQFSMTRVPPRVRRRSGVTRYDADHQVSELIRWLRPRTERVTRGERPITYRQLRQILKRHGYMFGQIGSNAVDICREEQVRVGLLRRETKTVQKPIGTIGYHSEGQTVSMKDIKRVRRLCRLTEEHGVDTSSFYDGTDIIDAFVNRYRTVLRRLAKT